MNITYHMVPKQYFESTDVSIDYKSAAFEKEGFIHCTDGEFMVSSVANTYYASIEGEMLILFIDKDKVTSPIRFDDEKKLFPHIYGGLNRDSVFKISKMIRDRKGDWIFPINEAIRCIGMRGELSSGHVLRFDSTELGATF